MKAQEKYIIEKINATGLLAISLSVIMPLVYFMMIDLGYKNWLWIFFIIGLFGLILTMFKMDKVTKLGEKLK